MCGICGFVTKREMPNGSAILERMVATLRHRGPDACGIWVKGMGQRAWGQEQGADEREGCAGSFPFALCSPPFAYLGHTRLAVLDLSEAGRQPMPNEDGSVWIVYNGEVYNFAELRAELERRGHRFRSRTDTEVLLHAYEEWGVEFVKRLQGMFAFAIWDSREGQRERGAGRLLLVRDRLGIKPLYYAFLPDGTLVFGSELKAILEYPEVPREVDPVALDAYFAYGYIPAPLTIYRAIRKLPPAHYLVWQEGQISLHRYWHLDYTRKRTESPEALAEELRQRLRETVKLHLISDVPLGAFLSGGMDSSTIVALMAQVATALSRPSPSGLRTTALTNCLTPALSHSATEQSTTSSSSQPQRQPCFSSCSPTSANRLRTVPPCPLSPFRKSPASMLLLCSLAMAATKFLPVTNGRVGHCCLRG